MAVIGGGVAGLFAAAACRRAGHDVVLVDRDRLDEPGPRPGVPQGPQPHAYLRLMHSASPTRFTSRCTAAI